MDELNGTDLRGKGLTFEFRKRWFPVPPESDRYAYGFAGCNDWHAEITHHGAFADLTVTKKICPDEQVMQTERNFLAALAKVTAILQEEDKTVTLAGDGVTIKLSRVAS